MSLESGSKINGDEDEGEAVVEEEEEDAGKNDEEEKEGEDIDDDDEDEVFLIAENNQFGRHVISACDIQSKGLILDEVPVMVAPWPIDDMVTFEEPLCLGCCRHMKGPRDDDDDNQEEGEEKRIPIIGNTYRCSKCGWPVCSECCEEISHHKENECQLFQEHQLPYPPPGDHMNIVTSSVMIQLIRCLLIKRRDLTLWRDSILRLQNRTALGTQPWNFDLLLDDIQLIFPVLEDELGTRNECRIVLSVININAFSNTFNDNSEFSGCAICLFLEASMISHSCTPNCWWTLTEDNSHRIVIKASEPISKGQLITVCYSSQYSVFGTGKRQEVFRNVGGFTCKCKRCLDPSELDSNVSAVLCENCMIGHRLPLVPTEPESKWRCGRCGHLESGEIVEGLVKALEDRLSSCVGNVPLLVRFLENSKQLLHNNHWIVTQAEDAIMREWATEPELRYKGGTPQEVVLSCEYFVSICFHVLSVRNVTSPGLSFHRVRYLLFFARARLARLEFLVSIMEERPTSLGRITTASRLPDKKGTGDFGFRNQKNTQELDSEILNMRTEYQEILQLYHDVLEFREMSSVGDDELRCEIEHLIQLMTPIVQMEPHHRALLGGGGGTNDKDRGGVHGDKNVTDDESNTDNLGMCMIA
ncbi:unnamed protein product [Orchesella dallaii]|uniref:SET domain-containing protein n=1 Tax=Orchesella dallaii TaxID=48710 RepID=A0ABP1RMI9_9HEXA